MNMYSKIVRLGCCIASLVATQPSYAALKHSESSSSSSTESHHRNRQGKWQPLVNQPQFVSYNNQGKDPQPGGANNPLLLTDGSVLVQNNGYYATGEIWKLTPDEYGSYINGTWSQLTSLPQGYMPTYFASAVLSNGNVLFEGGEYNGAELVQDLTDLGAIYNPFIDAWFPMSPPPFFDPQNIGDAAGAILEDGTFMLANALSRQAALLDPETLSWKKTGIGTKQDINGEEGWTLLPNGKLLVVNCSLTAKVTTNVAGVGPFYSRPANYSYINNLPPTAVSGQAALVTPDINACNAPLDDLTGKIALFDFGQCGSGTVVPNIQNANAIAALGTFEGVFMAGRSFQTIYFGSLFADDMEALRNALTVYPNLVVTIEPIVLPASQLYDPATGIWSNAGQPVEQLADVTLNEIGAQVLRPDGTVFVTGATGNTGIFNSKTKTWHAGPRIPNGPGSQGPLGCQDGAGALLPNGHVLFTASPISEPYSPPMHIFEFDGKKIIEQPTVPGAESLPGFAGAMLVLPTGQILMTSFSNDVEIFTPGDRSYKKEWAPKITDIEDHDLRPGNTYKISGIRFNGMSQGAMYGDDYQAATNYPLVRITNKKTGHVKYCPTHHHSYMGVASDKKVHTYFDVPGIMEEGDSMLEVVVNGIPSKPIKVKVKKCSR